jgi:hypothetical protein
MLAVSPATNLPRHLTWHRRYIRPCSVHQDAERWFRLPGWKSRYDGARRVRAFGSITGPCESCAGACLIVGQQTSMPAYVVGDAIGQALVIVLTSGHAERHQRLNRTPVCDSEPTSGQAAYAIRLGAAGFGELTERWRVWSFVCEKLKWRVPRRGSTVSSESRLEP